MRCTLVPVVAGALALLVPVAARATWSIVAVDPVTREVGVAGATCNATVHERIPGLVPDVGALASQAASFDPNRQLALQLMRDGRTPGDILAMVAAQDSQWETRQMGIADLMLASAAHTGAQNNAWAGDEQVPGVSVQGNILRGAEVVSDAMAAMTAAAPACPYTLGDRLMAAMEAARDRGGDSRCPEDAPARSAFLFVARPTDQEGAPTLEIIVPDSASNEDPVASLRQQYDAWRAVNPPPDEGCDGTGTDDGAGTTSGAGTTGSGGGGAGGTSSTGGGPTTGESATEHGPGVVGDDAGKGCGCSSDRDVAAWSFAPVLVVLRRRRS